MLQLIINADDLGLTPGCNAGIVQALTAGIVSDTTMLINTDYTQAAVELLKASGINQAGLHLNLTFGAPVSPLAEVPSLVDDNGRFRRKIVQSVKLLNPREVEHELRAQIAKFHSTGLRLTHLDSHHHAHSYPQLLDIAVSLAKELNTPLRQTSAAVKQKIIDAGVVTTDFFSLDFYEQGATQEKLQQIILSHSGGVLEIMCHPAQGEKLIYEISAYNSCREKELAILIAPELKEFLRQNAVELISFADLRP
jgi:predicted glycoside hydrolase/deacetylase ChbG (UPF0249 family)